MLDEDQHGVISDPQLAHELDDRRRRVGAVAEDLGLLPWPGGTTSRTSRAAAPGRSGARGSIGFFCARSFAGTDG